jgi:hypothetical protein
MTLREAKGWAEERLTRQESLDGEVERNDGHREVMNGHA